MVDVVLPYNFDPRHYQEDLFKAFMRRDYKRFFYIWHRRGGKDLTALNLTIWDAMQNVGVYWHLLPKYTQCRKAIWDGMDNEGRKFIDYIPKEIIKSKNKQEMKIELINGSIWQLQGSDNYDDLLSTNPRGVVFSEYGYSNPAAWGKIQPILEANGGWAIFETTPNGENHAFDLYHKAEQLDYWFTETLRIDQTKKEVNGELVPVITEQQIELIRAEGMDEDKIQQEYYCSWKASLIGAYYSEQMRQAEADRRITTVPLVDGYEVHTWWDLGNSDYTSIWFVQYVGTQILLVDYYQDNGKKPSHYAEELKNRKYNYGSHNIPHDGNHVHFSSDGKSAKDWLTKAGLEGVKVHERTNDVGADINTARMLLSRCVFDKEKCYDGIQALKSYRKKYNELKKCYENNPYHDWASHGADAFRYLSVGYKETFGVKTHHVRVGDAPTFDDYRKPRRTGRKRV